VLVARTSTTGCELANAFLGRSVLAWLELGNPSDPETADCQTVSPLRREFEDNTAAVAPTLRYIAAGFGHPIEIPGGIKKEITFRSSTVSATSKGIKDALRPRAFAGGRKLEDDTASGVAASGQIASVTVFTVKVPG
jgi:hypothetical protein